MPLENKNASGIFRAQFQRENGAVQWHIYMNGLQVSLVLIDDVSDALCERQQWLERTLP